MSLKIPLLGPASHEQLAHFNFGVLLQPLALENPEEPDVVRAQPHVGRQSLLAKVGPAALHLKANKEPRLMERKVCFLLQASNLVGRANSRPKADFPYLTLPPTVSRKEIL